MAPEVVKDVLNCPQKAQQLSDLLLLRGGVDELLILTQTDTVPYLVLTKRHDVLRRIAQARSDINNVEGLIMQPRRNLACVMSRLLLESGASESVASSLLQEAAPNLKGKFTELVQVDPINTACEILKTAAEHDQMTGSKVIVSRYSHTAPNVYRYMKHLLFLPGLPNQMSL